MYGPSGFLDEYGRLYMSGGGGRYFPTEGDESPPGYLTWDAHIGEVHAEIKRIYKAIADNCEISMSLIGMDEGGIESGRALMYKLIRSLAMKSRKAIYLEAFLKILFRVVQKMKIVWLDELGKNIDVEPRRDWGDEVLSVNVVIKNALPTDTREYIGNVTTMLREKAISRKTAIEMLSKYFEEIDPDTEMDEIAKDVSAETAAGFEALGVSPVEMNE